MKAMPTGIPIANSFRTSRRRTTAIRQTATVTQNRKTGNQPETMEMLPRSTEVARITAATATAATTAMTRRRPGSRDGPVVWFVVRVWVLMVNVRLPQLGSSVWMDPLSAEPGPQSLGKLPSSPPQGGSPVRIG